jgi:phosphatidylserine/phosphatidylglycerophosphate/cardiolipin synthase-like enzyme
MRLKVVNDELTVFGIAGTYVVMLGFSIPRARARGLRGFAVARTDHETDETVWMRGMKTFEGIGPAPAPGVLVSSQQHPYQSFQWADYSARPGRNYTYKIVAMRGTPGALVESENVEVTLTTEDPGGQRHDIYFNRGVAGSQEYARRFQDRPPDEVGQAAFDWLSRGLVEALVQFIEQAEGGKDEIVAAVYEFRNAQVMAALKAAQRRGADVKLLYGADKKETRDPNESAIKDAGIARLCDPRENGPGIPHNKFFVWSRDGEPQAVWTGSTNLTKNGIFGHSNLGHVVRIKSVARQFREYWELLSGDPDGRTTREWTNSKTPVPIENWVPATQVVFSPRAFPAEGNGNALNWFAELARGAESGLFMTFAFGINEKILNVFQQEDEVLRFALMEKEGMTRTAAEAVRKMRRLPNAIVAVGNRIKANNFDRWLAEDARVSAQVHIEYIHTKYMLIDPLSDEPMVVTGSANFSKASVQSNDENVLLIRGETRVADIYLGEFMRLFSHHAFREFLARTGLRTDIRPQHLDSTDSWTRDYYEDNASARQARRKYFAAVPA